jgi:hypothetical protein
MNYLRPRFEVEVEVVVQFKIKYNLPAGRQEVTR